MAALSVRVETPGIERGKDSATDYTFSQIKAKTEGSMAGKKELQFQLQSSRALLMLPLSRIHI